MPDEQKNNENNINLQDKETKESIEKIQNILNPKKIKKGLTLKSWQTITAFFILLAFIFSVAIVLSPDLQEGILTAIKLNPRKRGNGICDARSGENSTNCCIDCGCSADYTCQNNACSCSNECNQNICVDDSSFKQCSNLNQNSCLELSETQKCNNDQKCQDGSCVCRDMCTTGKNVCADDTHYQTCGNFDDDACLEPGGETTACGAELVCGDGACVKCYDSDGDNKLTQGQVIGFKSSNLSKLWDYCIGSNSVNEGVCNFIYGPVQNLRSCSSGYSCFNGVCLNIAPDCKNECDKIDANICIDEKSYSTCSQMDDDICYEFGAKTTCDQYCYKGACIMNSDAAGNIICSGLETYNNVKKDASGIIQSCINSASYNQIVELPAGKYYIGNQIKIEKAGVVLRTEGRKDNMEKCSLENHDCAELVALPELYSTSMILLNAPNAVLDHMVINGDKFERLYSDAGKACRFALDYPSTPGGNIGLGFSCDNCRVSNSVSKNALCGSALGVSRSYDKNYVTKNKALLIRNIIANNAFHYLPVMLSDGVTFSDGVDSLIVDNEFIDNSDIDLVFGGCKNCIIKGNKIIHTDSIIGMSQGALIMHAWENTSGDYTNTKTYANTIDCGSSKNCGFGLLLGSDAFYQSNPFGGSVFDNKIKNAIVGFSIDDAHDMIVNNNIVEDASSFVEGQLCNTKTALPYSKGSRTYNIKDLNGNDIIYPVQDYDNCVPGWLPVRFWWSNVDYLVKDLYMCILERKSSEINVPGGIDEAGFNSWKNIILSGANLDDIFKIFFNSGEYQDKNTSNEQYINQLYRCVFYRPADVTGFNYYLGELNAGNITRAAILDTFINHDEFQKGIKPALNNVISP